MSLIFDVHHGTSLECAKSIIQTQYISSPGDSHWLGEGAYFFIDGLDPNTETLAESWAIAESWDKISKVYRYSEYGVLRSVLIVDEDSFLDLTTPDGVAIFSYLKIKYREKIKGKNRKMDFIDGRVINLARGEGVIPIDAAKGSFYFKFRNERIFNIHSRIPNCTICVVFNPSKNISKTQLTKVGKIL